MSNALVSNALVSNPQQSSNVGRNSYIYKNNISLIWCEYAQEKQAV